MKKAGKNKAPRLQPRAQPSPREAELLKELAAMEAGKDGPKLVDPETGRPKQLPSLRDAIEQELPYAVSRRALVAYFCKLYKVSSTTVDRAIVLAKDAYAEDMRRPKQEQREEGKAFMRLVQRTALKRGKTMDAIAAKKYELELAGATSPGGLDPEGTGPHAPLSADETRAIILARLAAKAQT